MKKKNVVGPLVWLSLAGGLLVWWMTGPFGLGLFPSSVTYLQAARSLAMGQGLMAYDRSAALVPLMHQGPGLPVLLAGGWFLGMGFQEWARIFNAFFFGGSIFLLGMTVYQLTRDIRAVLIGAGLMFSSVHLLETYGKLLAEPLFLFLMLGFLFSWMVFINKGLRGAFYAAALCAGMAAATRYSGVVLIIAAVWWLWIRGRRETRGRDMVFFAITAGYIPALVVVRNLLLSGYCFGTVPGKFPLTLEKIYVLINSFSEWVVPSRVPVTLRWVVLGLVIGGSIRLARDRWIKFAPQAEKGILFLTGTGVLYVAAEWVIMLFGHREFVFNHRVLLPVYLGLIMAVACTLPSWEGGGTLRKKIVLAVFLSVAASGVLRSAQVVYAFHEKGTGYTSKAVSGSKLAETLRSLDDQVPLYANDPEGVYYFASRPAVKIPAAGQDASGLPGLPKMVRDFRELRGVAVILDKEHFVPGAIWKKLSELAGLEVLMKDPAGDIDGVRPKPKAPQPVAIQAP